MSHACDKREKFAIGGNDTYLCERSNIAKRNCPYVLVVTRRIHVRPMSARVPSSEPGRAAKYVYTRVPYGLRLPT